MRKLPLLSTLALLALPVAPPAAPPAAAPLTVAPLAAFGVAEATSAAAMRAAGGQYAQWAAAGRRFLAFDPHGDGTAAEVVGDDPATADRIVIMVPGVDTTLRNFDRGLGGVARRAPAQQARAVFAQVHATDPQARLSVIAWLGYDTPEGIGLAAITEARARAGAAALTAFVDGVQAQRPDAEVTLVGHSYGAIVVGLAARRLPQVHRLIVFGAPGMGVAHASDLGGATVWSALAAADWMHRIPQLKLFGLGHGRRPSSPGFGALPLPAAGVAGHDFYLVPGSPTLDAIAGIVLDRSGGSVSAGRARAH